MLWPARSAREKLDDEDHVLLEVAHILKDAIPLFRTRTALR